jgi:trehalose 6-phosphate phosphatase
MSIQIAPIELATRIAALPSLLVAADFDGTLSPLSWHHSQAEPAPGAVTALDRLSGLPRTRVAVVSGRGLADIRARLGSHDRWDVFGSHGAESREGTCHPIAGDMRLRLDALEARVTDLRAHFAELVVESKPRGVAVHFRALSSGDAKAAEASVLQIAADYPQLGLQSGSKVVEFLADRVTKADALASLRSRHDVTDVVFIGDDLTDEHAFRSMRPSDFSVKVGPGGTAARFRLPSVDTVVEFLTLLAGLRERSLRDSVPSEQFAASEPLQTSSSATRSAHRSQRDFLGGRP